MQQSLALDQGRHSEMTFCSWEQGWRSLLLRQYQNRDLLDATAISPVAEQTIILVTRGACRIECVTPRYSRSADYAPGSIGMKASNHTCRIRWRTASADPYETLHLYLPAGEFSRAVAEVWDRDPRQVELPNILVTTDPVLEQTMLGLLHAAKAGEPDLYAETAVVFLSVHTLIRHGAYTTTRTYRGDDERIRRARSFIRENLHLPLTLGEMATEAGMSRYHFVRAFRAQTGETPHRYLTRLRVEQGQHELARSSGTITEIAERTGFANPAHFASVFRREVGVSPSAYRREVQDR